jgi:tetratricopeptide (TPR) repeat protein
LLDVVDDEVKLVAIDGGDDEAALEESDLLPCGIVWAVGLRQWVYDIDFWGAIADYDQVIKLQPDDADAYFNRGLARYDLEDKQAAIADFRKASELYQKQGDMSSFEKALEQIQELQK